MNATQTPNARGNLGTADLTITRIELVPGLDWHKDAAQGRKNMFFSIDGIVYDSPFGAGTTVTMTLDAVSDDNEVRWPDFVRLGQDGQPALQALCNRGDGDHAALTEYTLDEAGRRIMKRDGDGAPVLAEPAIPGFDMSFGMRYLVPVNHRKMLRLYGARVYALRQGSNLRDYGKIAADSAEVVDAAPVMALGADQPAARSLSGIAKPAPTPAFRRAESAVRSQF